MRGVVVLEAGPRGALCGRVLGVARRDVEDDGGAASPPSHAALDSVPLVRVFRARSEAIRARCEGVGCGGRTPED